MSRVQIEKDFAQLYIGQNQKLLVESYYRKKKKTMLLFIAVAAGLLLVLIFQALQKRRLEEGRLIERNAYGQGSREVKLEVELEEGGWQPVTITLEERQYSQEEIEKSFDEAEKILPDIILGENTSVDEIRDDLYLPSELEGCPLHLSWKSSNPDLLDSRGKLHEKKLSEQNELIMLTVKMEYGEWQREHSFYVRIMEKKKITELSVLEKLSDNIQRTEAAKREVQVLELPVELENNNLRWRYPLDKSIFIFFALIPILLFIIWQEQDKEIHKKAEERKKLLQSGYPEFVTKLILFLEAGMTVKGAFFRITEDYQRKREKGKENNYLYEELQYICQRMKNGMSEKDAYEMLGIRCELPLYRKLSTLLIQNLQKGAAGMLDTLRQEGWKANEERKNQVKRKGEEAGTKLLFPMMVMLGIVMLLIIVPACFSFQM